MVNSETRQCQNCKSSFEIDAQDFGFYEKVKVPPPTWCPECRNMRRLAWREKSSLFRDVCKLCGRAIITIHAPDGPFTVYCRECWRSDKWDSMDYGRDYDFNKPFFSQYRELMEAVPRPALTGTNLVNSDFTHASLNLKNCHYVFWSYYSEDSQNCYGLLLSRNSYDCYITDNSDHAYESLHSNRLYRVRFGYFADDCLDSAFLYDCVGCSDCFGCINLRKQKYCLFNQKLPKEEYFARVKYWDLGSYHKLKEAKEKFRALYLATPRRYAHVLNSENVTGDIIRDTKDCQTCFSALDGVQNCRYLYFGGLNLKDSQDVSAGGDTSELLYEACNTSGHVYQASFVSGAGNSRDVTYCDWPRDSQDLFGCVSVRNKRYCILNKRYTREEYEALIPKIKEQMNAMPYRDKRGREYRFGEFFPTELSAYAYNENNAFYWYPKTKAEVLAEGWQWREPVLRDYKITLPAEELPDHIQDVKDAVLEETIGCHHQGKCNEQCTTAFRINREELEFYRKMNVALPRLCPNCRDAERLKWRNRFHLWPKRCMCAGSTSSPRGGASGGLQTAYRNTAEHFHESRPCPNEFETTYAPDCPEIVYCDKCYKAEFM